MSHEEADSLRSEFWAYVLILLTDADFTGENGGSIYGRADSIVARYATAYAIVEVDL